MEEMDKQLLQYIKKNYHIKYSFVLTPKQELERPEELSEVSENTEDTERKETRGRPSYYNMVKEFIEATNKDTLLLPELSEKIGVPTDKLSKLLPEFNYHYDEPTRLWHKRK